MLRRYIKNVLLAVFFSDCAFADLAIINVDELSGGRSVTNNRHHPKQVVLIHCRVEAMEWLHI